MRNLQGIAIIRTRTYSEIFKTCISVPLNNITVDRYITTWKQLFLMVQNFGTLYLMAAKMQFY